MDDLNPGLSLSVLIFVFLHLNIPRLNENVNRDENTTSSGTFKCR